VEAYRRLLHDLVNEHLRLPNKEEYALSDKTYAQLLEKLIKSQVKPSA